MAEQTEVLRKNLSDLSNKNNPLQSEPFGTITENYQAEVSCVRGLKNKNLNIT